MVVLLLWILSREESLQFREVLVFAKSEFNRATQASRQPGSALKPFIYALALESQFKPNTLILECPNST